MAARLGARVGKVLVGGLAVTLSYRLSNSTIESWSERNKYSHKRMGERLRQRPAVVEMRREVMLERGGAEKFDVVVVADSPRASQLGLDCAVAGLRTLIIDSEDFNSNLSSSQERSPREIGSFSFLKSLYSDEELSWRDKLAVIFQGDPDISLLSTAPHLSWVMRTVVMSPSLVSLYLQFLADKLSDLALNKPPQHTARLSSEPAPAWYRPRPHSYQLSIIAADSHRLSLIRVLTAAHHGAVVINLADIRDIARHQEEEEESLLLSLEDKLTGRVIEVKTEKLIRLDRTCRAEEGEEGERDQCFLLAGRLLEERQAGYYWAEENVVMTRDQEGTVRACVGSCSSHSQAFDKLREMVSEVHIVRRSDLQTVEVGPRSDSHWTVETSEGVTTGQPSLLSPLQLQSPASPVLLLGSHGWSPHLPGLLATRYGLSVRESEALVRRWGDRAGEVARSASSLGLLAAEVVQACSEELCVSLHHLCARLAISDLQEVRAAAKIMQAELGWSNSTRDRHLKHCLQWLSISQELDQWKLHTLETQLSDEDDEKFILSAMNNFQKMCREDGTISHAQLQDYLESEDSPCGERSLSDSQMDRVLRSVDVERNGKYSQAEFLALLRRIHVLTPEEVIEQHVDQIIKTKTNS